MSLCFDLRILIGQEYLICSNLYAFNCVHALCQTTQMCTLLSVSTYSFSHGSWTTLFSNFVRLFLFFIGTACSFT